jgi:S1-C subfamily serine protease
MRSPRSGRFGAGLLAAYVLGAQGAAPARAWATDAERQALIEKVRPAYVFIAGGSGAVISADGFMITNHHVLEGRKSFAVRLGDGRSFQAAVVGIDRGGDLALLRIEKASGLAFLPLGDSDTLRVGEPCLAVGNPIALGLVDQLPTFTVGVISGLHQFRGVYNDAIVCDAPINPGNSGGPLVNRRGELVGVNGLVQTRWGLRANTGLGYAIPSNQVKRWLPLLKDAKGGEVHHGRLLGLEWKENDEEAGSPTIKSVKPGSDADRAGFRAGDAILAVGGQPVWGPARLAGLLRAYPAGCDIPVRVRRDAADRTLAIKLDALRQAAIGFKLALPKPKDPYTRIDKVDAGSAAEKAGLKVGDEIVGLEGQHAAGPVQNQALIIAAWLSRKIAGETIRLRVRRGEGGKSVEKDIEYVAQ